MTKHKKVELNSKKHSPLGTKNSKNKFKRKEGKKLLSCPDNETANGVVNLSKAKKHKLIVNVNEKTPEAPDSLQLQVSKKNKRKNPSIDSKFNNLSSVSKDSEKKTKPLKQRPAEISVQNVETSNVDLIQRSNKKKVKKLKKTIDQNSMDVESPSSRADTPSKTVNNLGASLNKKKNKKKRESDDEAVKPSDLVNTVPSDNVSNSDYSEFDADSYPSDTDDEEGKSPFPSKTNFADVSSEESSSDEESVHSDFDAESYPSDTEDEDETTNKKNKGLPINATPSAELEDQEKRTIFVGNLPKSVERLQLKKWFFKFGDVECVRLRSAPIADPELPRKVAVIKKTFHENRNNIHAYIRFKTEEAAKNAIQANGALFDNHVIRVDCSVHEGKYDARRGVFVGNVPFSMEEDTLRKFFLDCGDIDSIRIIRDKNTGVGKGFAYINFKCSTAIPLALKLDGETLEKRELRVKPIKYEKKNAKTFMKRPPPQYHSKKFYKKPLNKDKTKKFSRFQGEVAHERVKRQPYKKSAEDRKREKFSKIFTNKNKNSV